MAGYVDFGTNTTDTTAAGVCAAVCPGGTSDDCGAGWSKK